MKKDNYDVNIVINGNRSREYIKDSLVYVEGRVGTEYAVEIKNNQRKRILAVVSVDGLNVISGEKASYNGQGYIIEGFSSIKIKGWRKSMDNVAQFVFSNKDDSYSKLMEKGESDLGVIGVAIFEEKEKETIVYREIIEKHYPLTPINPYPSYPITWYATCEATGSCQTTNLNQVNCSASSISKNEIIGTGWGNEVKSSVINSSFDRRSDSPDEIFSIFYGTRGFLESKGIDFAEKIDVISPNPFPGEFCKPPAR